VSAALRCDPEQVTALVDGALQADAAAAREAHLAECAPCRRLAEAERAVRTRLRALPAPEPPPGLERRVRARIAERRRRGRRPLWLALPVAAAVALALWSRGLAPLVAWELARDHRHCFGLASLPAQVRSAEPAVVADWFGRRGTPVPAVPASLAGARLFGARYCYLPDVSAAAHLYYTGLPRPLSLFVLTHGVRFEDGYTTASGGRTVALVRVEGAAVGVVGDSAGDVAAAVGRLRESALKAELLTLSGR
jgi:anti-sigma factor RsiW